MFLEVDIDSPVATLTFNDPERHNTLSAEMFTALRSALDLIESEYKGAVVRVRGNGPSFCSGLDLDACSQDRKTLDHFLTELSVTARRLRRMPKVVVAEVHGNALAGGCALLSACDIVCAEPDARFGYPVLRLGLSPAVSVPTLLDAIGPSQATALMLSEKIIDGYEAYRIGLAHQLAQSAETLDALTNDLCTAISKKGPHALATTKAWINTICGCDNDEPFEKTLDASMESGRTEEAHELLTTFWNRRKTND